MDYRAELEQMTDAATGLLAALPSRDRDSGGSLTVVGTGIMAIRQLTLESVAIMANAEALFHVIGEPIQTEALQAINPVSEDLTVHYVEGMDRSYTYEAMIDRIVGAVMEGKRTVAAFYGHPGVFTYPSHESVSRARAAGFPARMLPAVSAADCLYADLGVDPGDGSQAYEATDFLYANRPIDRLSHLILWQAGTLGCLTSDSTHSPTDSIPLLVRKLVRAYPRRHPVTLYEAPFEPGGVPRMDRIPIARLHAFQLTPATTLHIPPVPPMPAWPRV